MTDPISLPNAGIARWRQSRVRFLDRDGRMQELAIRRETLTRVVRLLHRAGFRVQGWVLWG